MKQDQFTWNWYPWLLVNHSQWTILEPLYYSSFLFATLVYGVIGINFVDHSLIQGAPAGYESAETPIGHESLMVCSWENEFLIQRLQHISTSTTCLLTT